MAAVEIGKKRHHFNYHGNSCKEDTILHQKHSSFTFKLPIIELSWLDMYKATKTVATSKVHFKKKAAKVKKVFLHFMTTFDNFTLKIETGWATWLVYPIWEI